MSPVCFQIAAWAAWSPSLVDEAAWKAWDGIHLPKEDQSKPAIGFVEPALRRRLGGLSRMALQVAAHAAGDHSIATVFSSRHGELSRTVTLLHDLARDESLSPTAFSLSVHNTASGVFSIARADHAPATALAAGDETFLWALLDAKMRLEAERLQSVLLVYADETIPVEYSTADATPEAPFALALRLAQGTELQLFWKENAREKSSATPLPLAFLAWWLGKSTQPTWHNERLTVEWQRRV